MWQWWIGAAVGTGVLVGMLIWQRRRHGRRLRESRQRDQAKRLFRRRREHLEARCLTRAATSGIPRGLIWADCEFEDGVAFARDRQTGRLQALVAVTIRFEAEAGGEMEEVEAVSQLRAATAVFYFDGSDWDTEGRVVFNLTPHETIERFRNELEPVDLR